MKKILFISALLLAVLIAFAAAAEEGVPVDEAHFPDATFRGYVAENCDADKNGILDQAEIDNIYVISVSAMGIGDLTGVELPCIIIIC